MRLATPHRPDLTGAEAHFASLRLWLIEIMAHLAELLGSLSNTPLGPLARAALSHIAPQLHAELRLIALNISDILFLRALARFDVRPRARQRARIRRTISARSLRRALTAGALPKLTGSPSHRAKLLKAVLDDPDTYTDRIVARLTRVIGRVRLDRPPQPDARSFRTLAALAHCLTPEPCAPDSS